jgi:hypothetical protein
MNGSGALYSWLPRTFCPADARTQLQRAVCAADEPRPTHTGRAPQAPAQDPCPLVPRVGGGALPLIVCWLIWERPKRVGWRSASCAFSARDVCRALRVTAQDALSTLEKDGQVVCVPYDYGSRGRPPEEYALTDAVICVDFCHCVVLSRA